MTEKELQKEPTNRIPLIKRARGYRLYDYQGNRIVDLYQNGGAAILGHRAGRLTTSIKNVISRGLIFDLPSIYERRLIRELSRRFAPFSTVRICSSRADALDLVNRYLGERLSWDEIKDPVLEERGHVCFHRPFLSIPPSEHGNLKADDVKAVLPLLPFSIGQAPIPVCFRGDPDAGFDAYTSDSEQPVSPILLAGLLRSIYDLDRFEKPEWYKGRLLNELKSWKQAGPYMVPRFPSENYPEVFQAFLKNGFLLSPAYRTPSILPGEVSPGEMQKMIRLFHKYPGE